MKRTRRTASEEDRYTVLARDGSDRCILCDGPGKDFDHHFRLSSYLPRVNEAWNLGILCLFCHDAVTNPDTKEKHEKAIKVMDIAYYRLEKMKGVSREIKSKYYYYLKSKRAKFNQQYGRTTTTNR